MYKVKRSHKLVALLVTLAFLAGLAPLGPSAQAISLGGAFGDLVKLFSISYIVRQFGGSINDFINSALGQREAAIEGRTKVVPILTIGNGGVAIGAAQVMGPAQQVDKVRAVGQIDASIGDFRGRYLLPLESDRIIPESLNPVPGVGISAVIAFPL